MSKNIVLLADGTGNGAASPFKTNVWRLYQALDLAGGTQIARYDDGVGTETLKPLAALGGAFGLGVWKNVRNLYTFLCRNYEPGDEVYLFGFSRGAFTVRLLAGLTARCGAVGAKTEDELHRNVAAAYSAYRRDYLYRASNVPRRSLMRWIRPILTKPRYRKDVAPQIDLSSLGIDQVRVSIRFVGVWDTVDAYGMPIDVWKRGIDQVVWPMSVADRDLSAEIHRVRHALSLDDERTTFRPVIWNELDRDGQPISRDRLMQVWFAGVHANVGGGYPDDALAYVALDWMMNEAAKVGLTFTAGDRDDVRDHANPNGKRYDSRAGVAGYYLYGPRSIERLRNDALHGVTMGPALLHQAVIDRVADRRVSCAPISPPLNFEILDAAGRIVTGSALDAGWMALAWNQVWRRSVVYLATVLSTVLLVLFPAFEHEGILARTTSTVEASVPFVTTLTKTVLSAGPRLLGSIPGVAPDFTNRMGTKLEELVTAAAPSWAGTWIKSFLHYPFTAAVLAGILYWLFFLQSTKIQARIAASAEMAWADFKGLGRQPPPITYADRVVQALRTKLDRQGSAFADWILPWVFGISTALFLLALAVVTLPFSLYPIWRLWQFLTGRDVETFRFGSPTPAPTQDRLETAIQ